MAGRTGYTEITNGDAPDFGPDITSVLEHFDPLIGETVANEAALPSSGNWVGRTIYASTEGSVNLWSGSAWIVTHVMYGWTTLAPLNGWNANTGSFAPQVSRRNTTVFYRGGFFGGATGDTVATVPTWARPARDTRVPFTTATDTIGYFRVLTTGSIRVSAALDGESMLCWTVS